MGRLIGDCDRCLANSVAQEVIGLAGTIGYIFQLEQEKSSKDALYDEEIGTIYKKDPVDGKEGIRIPMFFKAPDETGIVGEEGYRQERTSEIYLATKDMTDKGLTRLMNGDIILVWDTYWDVIITHTADGYISDTGSLNTTHRIELVRRTNSPAEALWLRHKSRN